MKAINDIKELTRGEEEVMQILWKIGEGSINDIIAQMAEPKPKYTTVATFVKILENKEFVEHKPKGKANSQSLDLARFESLK